MDSKLLEFFSYSTESAQDWKQIIIEQPCKYLMRKCIKFRKSIPEISIGSCMVKHGKNYRGIIICPHRLLQNRKIFIDCIHLLTLHEPGNELHVVPEISVPGGSVDFFVVSVKKRKVKDFVGIELQTMDTSGSVWNERQAFLDSQDIPVNEDDLKKKSFGINWKMTAKTILIQLHHKINTFEHLDKKLVLVTQDCLLDYMRKEFSFDRIKSAKHGDSMHFHSYSIEKYEDSSFCIDLKERLSTDSVGLSYCLGLKTKVTIKLTEMLEKLEEKVSGSTLLKI